MSIFEFKDYKQYLNAWIESQPRKGRGIGRKIAESTRLSPAMLSHILSGDKHFSPEAAMDVALFLGLPDAETDYFLLLVNYSRAGSHSLKKAYATKVAAEQKRNNELQKKVNQIGRAHV